MPHTHPHKLHFYLSLACLLGSSLYCHEFKRELGQGGAAETCDKALDVKNPMLTLYLVFVPFSWMPGCSLCCRVARADSLMSTYSMRTPSILAKLRTSNPLTPLS